MAPRQDRIYFSSFSSSEICFCRMLDVQAASCLFLSFFLFFFKLRFKTNSKTINSLSLVFTIKRHPFETRALKGKTEQRKKKKKRKKQRWKWRTGTAQLARKWSNPRNTLVLNTRMIVWFRKRGGQWKAWCLILLPLQFLAPLVFILPLNPKNTTAVVLVVSQESHPPKISDVESLLLLLLLLLL